jgi:cytochrome c oxidase subunit 1
MTTNTAPTSSSGTGFFKTLIDGNEGGLKADGLTPAQKLSLRFVVIGLIYFGFAAIEGMLMRIYQIEIISFIGVEQYFGILTAHPLVGIFGSSYMIVFGAFLFVIPFMMKKPLWSLKVGQASFLLVAIGTFTFWFSGFISHYAALYPLYWPLPADFDQFSALGGSFFILGIALVMVGTLLFVLNVFKSIMYTPEGWEQHPGGALLSSALGFTGFANLFRKEKKEHLVPLPVAAIARGTVDVALNALIITFSGALILVGMVWHGLAWSGIWPVSISRIQRSMRSCTRTGTGGVSTSSPTGSFSSSWPVPGICSRC